MRQVTVEIPSELARDLDRYVGSNKPYENRNDAVRAAIRHLIDQHDEIVVRPRFTDKDGDVP